MGNQLSGGEQQMLAIARALMTNPALLLLDEPLEGLAPIIVEELTAAIRRMIEASGTAIILAEQHAEIALSLTRDVLVLERGAIVYPGPLRCYAAGRGGARPVHRPAPDGAGKGLILSHRLRKTGEPTLGSSPRAAFSGKRF